MICKIDMLLKGSMFACCILTMTGFSVQGADSQKTFTVEILHVAKTAQKRDQGFMNQRSLKKNEAMLFLFPKKKKHCFWMKNTYVSLDIVLLDEKDRVIDVIYNMEPESLKSRCFKVVGNRALEIPAQPKHRRLRVGDQIILPK